MGTARYEPRQYAPEPARFGTFWVHRTWTPAPATPRERAQSTAAQLQDQVAGRVEQAITRRVFTKAEFARRIGWTPDRLTRALRGQTVMSVADIMLVLDALGVPFATLVAHLGDDAQRSVRDINVIREYLTLRQRDLAADIARIERATPPTSVPPDR